MIDLRSSGVAEFERNFGARRMFSPPSREGPWLRSTVLEDSGEVRALTAPRFPLRRLRQRASISMETALADRLNPPRFSRLYSCLTS